MTSRNHSYCSCDKATLAACRPTGGGLELRITGELTQPYRVQVSTNLEASGWGNWQSSTQTHPVETFLDPLSTNVAQRFYRVVSP